jgi:hypothetical protein
MSEAFPGFTATLAHAAEEARRRLEDGIGEAVAWVVWIRSGTPKARGCVVCDSRTKTEGHHVGGRRQGNLVVSVCRNCHRRLSERQNGWDPRYQSDRRSPRLEGAFLIRGLSDLCEERARHFGSAYHVLAKRLRAAYAVWARETI